MKPPILVRELSENERERLEAGLRSKDSFVMRRCQILLGSARGESPPKIARSLGCASQTVRNAIRAFNERGLDALGSSRPKRVHGAFDEKSAEQGLMLILEDEAATYGYTLEDRHMVGAFRESEEPLETFRDGVAVVEMLMALYRSAETGSTVYLPDDELETYVPPVMRGEYRG